MKVAAIQHDIYWHDPEPTHAIVDPMIDEAVEGGASLVVLSEMWATGFSMDPFAVCQAMDGPSVAFMIDRAARHGIWVSGSLAIHDDGLAYNRFIAAGPNGELVTYDKRHPFSYAGEHKAYSAGADLVSFEVDGLRVTPFVCYDLRFGDDFWRLGPDTDLFIVVANWPKRRREHWRTLLRARAIENQCFVVAANRIGHADDLDYSGDSTIIDPFGKVLAEAVDNPSVLLADVTADEVARIRSQYPFLADRR